MLLSAPWTKILLASKEEKMSQILLLHDDLVSLAGHGGAWEAGVYSCLETKDFHDFLTIVNKDRRSQDEFQDMHMIDYWFAQSVFDLGEQSLGDLGLRLCAQLERRFKVSCVVNVLQRSYLAEHARAECLRLRDFCESRTFTIFATSGEEILEHPFMKHLDNREEYDSIGNRLAAKVLIDDEITSFLESANISYRQFL